MTKNLESITIHQFRGLRDLELKDLGNINLLVGINNSGKTSVLEALSIYCHPLDLRVWISTARQREQEYRFSRTPPLDSIQWLFTRDPLAEKNGVASGNMVISSNGSFAVKQMRANYKIEEKISLVNDKEVAKESPEEGDEDLTDYENEDPTEIIKGINLDIELKTTDEQLNVFNQHSTSLTEKYLIWENEPFIRATKRREPSLATSMVTPSSHRSDMEQFRLLSDASFDNFKPDIIALLRQMDENISGIEILLPKDSKSSRFNAPRFNIYIQHEKLGLVPVSAFGDGVRRLLHIALKLASVKGGILLIDELESAIHTEALQTSFLWLVKWCKAMNVQLFATTHSLEAVDYLLEVTEGESDLAFYRLEPKETGTRVVRHGWERLKSLREELGQEVRW